MRSLGRILALARVELALLLRSPTTFTLLLLVPALQLLLFGYAIRPSGASVSVAVAAPTVANAERVAERLRHTDGMTVVASGLRPGAAAARVHRGEALVAVEVPPLRSLSNPTQVRVPLKIVVDGTNPSLTTAAVARIERAYWQRLAEQGDAADSGPGLVIERLYNPASRADWSFLPALIGVTVMIAMVMLGALSVAREREAGTWEALLALPLGRGEALVGKLLPYATLGTVQGSLVLGAAVALFDLPARGSVVALIALLPLFAAAHFVLGHAISARARTQLAALQGAVAFYLPAMLLSGFLYPFDTLPGWARTLGSVFPLTHLIRAAQGSLLHGDAAAAVLAHGVPMLAFLGAAALLALLARSDRVA